MKESTPKSVQKMKAVSEWEKKRKEANWKRELRRLMTGYEMRDGADIHDLEKFIELLLAE